MGELSVNQLIKIIIGIVVVVLVVGGIFLLFKGRILEFFKGLLTGTFFRTLLI